MSNLCCDFCNTRKEKLYKCGYKADRKIIKIYICKECIEKEKDHVCVMGEVKK